MKVYHSDTDDASPNGAGPAIDDPPEQDSEEYDYSQLFEAPNYADFIRTAPGAKANVYRKRVESLMKAGMIASLNANNYADAATFLKHGPGFATAAGNLAAVDARAERLVEMLTAPESPYVMFAMVAIPMVAQLARNHQDDVREAGASFRERRAQRKQERKQGVKREASTITVRLFKRQFKVPVRFKIKLPNFKNVFSAFLAPTEHPDRITAEVFQDPAVVKALHKLGVIPRQEQQREDAA